MKIEVSELQVRQLLWKTPKFVELLEEYNSLTYLGNFDAETLWQFYSEVIAMCTSDGWRKLSNDSRDLFLHLKLRVQKRDIEAARQDKEELQDLKKRVA